MDKSLNFASKLPGSAYIHTRISFAVCTQKVIRTLKALQSCSHVVLSEIFSKSWRVNQMANKSMFVKPVAAAVGVAFVSSLVVSQSALADTNPFSASSLDAGYQLAGEKDKEGKCGEGKCGADKEKGKEGSCGDKEKGKEGSCGDKEKGKEGSCGDKEKGKEGSCGDKKDKGTEGSCGGNA
jgi:uncharacterized low-complexity protein